MLTWPTRRSCSDEGDDPRPAQAGHPRPAGRGGAELAAPARLRGRRGARGPRDRPRAGRRGRPGRPRRARARLRAAAGEPVDRVLRDCAGAMSAEPGPRSAVVGFPGSNDDRDAALALERLGAEATLVWHAERELPEGGAVVLPRGFSYGDYLRCGAIARFAPVLEAVRAFAAEGGLVLGICNGFQVLCEAGLLPGALRPNATLEFVCRNVALRVERADTSFTSRPDPRQTLQTPLNNS